MRVKKESDSGEERQIGGGGGGTRDKGESSRASGEVACQTPEENWRRKRGREERRGEDKREGGAENGKGWKRGKRGRLQG